MFGRFSFRFLRGIGVSSRTAAINGDFTSDLAEIVVPKPAVKLSCPDLPDGVGRLPIRMCRNVLPNLVFSVSCNLGFITSLGKFLHGIRNLTRLRHSVQLQTEICKWKTLFFI